MKIVSVALALAAVGSIAAPTDAATFDTRTDFQAALGASFTDTYEAGLGYERGDDPISDAAMSSVVGQATYQSTGFADYNIILDAGSGQEYCAGCNGSFTLGFGQTSFGTAAGVFGVGLDVTASSRFEPYTAFITYGDGSTANVEIPRDGSSLSTSFFGVTSSLLIRSIAFGLPDGAATKAGYFSIDNLTIGSAAAVPEPAAWCTMILGIGAIGGAARRRRRAVAAIA